MDEYTETTPLLSQYHENHCYLKVATSLRLSLQIIWYLTWAWGECPNEKIATAFDNNWLKASTVCGIAAFGMDLACLYLTETSLHRRSKTVFRGVAPSSKINFEIETNDVTVKQQRYSWPLEKLVQLRENRANLPSRYYLAMRPIIAIFYFANLVPDTYIFFDALALSSLIAAGCALYVNKTALAEAVNVAESNIQKEVKAHVQKKYWESKIELVMSVWSLAWTVAWHFEPFPAGCCFIVTNIAQLMWTHWPATKATETQDNKTGPFVLTQFVGETSPSTQEVLEDNEIKRMPV